MKKIKTLEEQIARMKVLAAINESDGEEKLEKELEVGLETLIKKTTGNIANLGKVVGDKDGDLEDPAQPQQESLHLTEAGLGLIAGSALAAPKVIEMIGKGIRQLGKKANSDTIKNVGEKVSDAGIKLHHKYEGTIAGLLKKFYPNKSEDFYKGASKAIILSLTVALGISAATSAVSAAQAGQAALAGYEGGLGAVKGIEIGSEITSAASRIMPSILNGFLR